MPYRKELQRVRRLVRFGWDEDKRQKNRRKHQVDFSDVLPAFDDPHQLYRDEWDENSAEWREVIVAMAGERLYSICYTVRQDGDLYWLISARRADRNEIRGYRDA